MKATNYATLLIKSFEALRLNSYLCPAGRWTIGYGHTEGVNQGMLITEKTADAFLRQDIHHAEAEVNRIDADLARNSSMPRQLRLQRRHPGLPGKHSAKARRAQSLRPQDSR